MQEDCKDQIYIVLQLIIRGRLIPVRECQSIGVMISHDLSWSRHICDTVAEARNVPHGC